MIRTMSCSERVYMLWYNIVAYSFLFVDSFWIFFFFIVYIYGNLSLRMSNRTDVNQTTGNKNIFLKKKKWTTKKLYDFSLFIIVSCFIFIVLIIYFLVIARDLNFLFIAWFIVYSLFLSIGIIKISKRKNMNLESQISCQLFYGSIEKIILLYSAPIKMKNEMNYFS